MGASAEAALVHANLIATKSKKENKQKRKKTRGRKTLAAFYIMLAGQKQPKVWMYLTDTTLKIQSQIQIHSQLFVR